MGKAPSKSLERLHSRLAEVFGQMLDTGELTASDLNVIRQFLKDNGISAVAAPNSPMGDLIAKLPFVVESEHPN